MSRDRYGRGDTEVAQRASSYGPPWHAGARLTKGDDQCQSEQGKPAAG
jgi:hypothetical protein